MKKSSIILATAADALPLLNSMSRPELTAMAKVAKVKVGKSRVNTIGNLTNAIREGKLHFKSCCTLSTNPAKQGEFSQRVTHFGKNLRTYVSGPGKGNSTWLTPANPRHGSPMEACS